MFKLYCKHLELYKPHKCFKYSGQKMLGYHIQFFQIKATKSHASTKPVNTEWCNNMQILPEYISETQTFFYYRVPLDG